MYTEFAIDPIGSGGNAYGVFIDGVIYPLEGEPAPYMVSLHFGGNGQR